MNAGAVMLTDSVYWFFIFPFLTTKDYNLNFVSTIYNLLALYFVYMAFCQLFSKFIYILHLEISSYYFMQMTIDMHTVNLILLLGDTALNCLVFSFELHVIFPYKIIFSSILNFFNLLLQRVPLFRISFFILWTGVFVIFQWILHACMSIW